MLHQRHARGTGVRSNRSEEPSADRPTVRTHVYRAEQMFALRPPAWRESRGTGTHLYLDTCGDTMDAGPQRRGRSGRDSAWQKSALALRTVAGRRTRSQPAHVSYRHGDNANILKRPQGWPRKRQTDRSTPLCPAGFCSAWLSADCVTRSVLAACLVRTALLALGCDTSSNDSRGDRMDPGSSNTRVLPPRLCSGPNMVSQDPATCTRTVRPRAAYEQSSREMSGPRPTASYPPGTRTTKAAGTESSSTTPLPAACLGWHQRGRVPTGLGIYLTIVLLI